MYFMILNYYKLLLTTLQFVVVVVVVVDIRGQILDQNQAIGLALYPTCQLYQILTRTFYVVKIYLPSRTFYQIFDELKLVIDYYCYFTYGFVYMVSVKFSLIELNRVTFYNIIGQAIDCRRGQAIKLFYLWRWKVSSVYQAYSHIKIGLT